MDLPSPSKGFFNSQKISLLDPGCPSPSPIHRYFKSENDDDNERDVLFVASSNAKALKTALEETGFLDKNFRMTKASENTTLPRSESGCIAVPVTKECLIKLEEGNVQWANLVVGQGKQVVPFSAVCLAKQGKDNYKCPSPLIV